MKKEEAFKLGVAQTNFRKNFKRKKRIKKARSFILWFLSFCVLSVILFTTCFHTSICVDRGMEGTSTNSIKQGETVISNKLAFLVKRPQRGEVITCRLENAGNKLLQRRIIAFPGETIEFMNGNIFINGQKCTENYVSGTTRSTFGTITVPGGCYYVLSDNRDLGPDSRDGVYVSQSDIIGSVILHTDFPSSINELAESITKYLKPN